MGRKGKLTEKWPRHYDPNPVQVLRRKVNFVPLSAAQLGLVERDLMCDYIEEGAEWWIARSEKTVNQILAQFDRGDAACCLYERIGAIIPLGEGDRWHLIALQLIRTGFDWDLDVTLADLGIYLEELWDGDEIQVGSYVTIGNK